jgi:hypothetical protein
VSEKTAPPLQSRRGCGIITTKESAVWQTVSTFPVGQLQRMTAGFGLNLNDRSGLDAGKSFFVIEDLVRNIEHAKVYSCKQREQS